MKIKKYITLLLILINIVIVTTNVYADDLDMDEENDAAWIYETIEDASSIVNDEPIINARAAVIYDRTSDEVLWGKEENIERKMASTTKIMTAIVVLENMTDMTDIVTVSSKSAGIGGSRLRITYRR